MIIVAGLAGLFPDIPILSEEGDEAGYKETQQETMFWLVDPLDGTKDFIARTGEFTVCAGLISGDEPVFGVVSVPAQDTIYYGGPGIGSYKLSGGENLSQSQRIYVSTQIRNVIMASGLTQNAATQTYIQEHFADSRIRAVGSMLKFMQVAEGSADAYPRIGSTMSLWDIAAGHAIVTGAGGIVSQPNGASIDYRAASLLVGDFIAYSPAISHNL
jgi:3'(2'), 5'-bisphosphate nucleotidase